jgi:hypothetical protein
MKNFFALLALLLLLAVPALPLRAQTDYSQRGATSRLSVGAGGAIGVGIPIGTLDSNLEAAPGFAYRIGLNITYPIARTLGVHFNTGIDSRGFGKKVGSENSPRSYRATYFFIEPGINVSAFRLSLNVGMPMSYTQPVAGGQPGESEEGNKENLATLLEPRAGATLVLVDSKESWLGLTFDLGFPLGELQKAGVLLEGDIPSTRPLSIHLGMTYQFAVPGT